MGEDTLRGAAIFIAAISLEAGYTFTLKMKVWVLFFWERVLPLAGLCQLLLTGVGTFNPI